MAGLACPLAQKPDTEAITPGMHASASVIEHSYEFLMSKRAR